MTDTPPPSLLQRLLAARVTVALFAICVVVFVLAETEGSTQDTKTLLQFGATWRGAVWNGEWWRLGSSMFLHIGIIHLVWNLWAGFSWSAPFERAIGPLRFLVIYLVSGIAGSALSVIGHDAVAAGASGALFGVLGGVMVLRQKMAGSWTALWALPAFRRDALMTALWLAIGPFVGFDSFAHLGGMLAGAALTWTLTPLHVGNFGASLAAVALLVWVSLRPMPGLHDDWLGRQRASEAYARSDWAEVVKATELLPTPPDPQLLFMRAYALAVLDRAAEAEPLLRGLEGPAGSVAALRAQVHAGLGKFDVALEDVRLGLKEAPDDPFLRRVEVWVLSQRGEYTKADEAMEQLLRQSPRDPDLQALRARTLLGLRRPTEALALLDEARKAAPDKHGELLVEALIALGRTDDAREAVAGVEASMRVPMACYVELNAGDLAAAAKHCSDPKHPWMRELRATFAAMKDDCAGAREALSGASPTRFARMIDAACLVKDGKPAEAVAILDSITVPGERDPELLLLRLAASPGAPEAAETRAQLEGEETALKRTLVWRMIPEEARSAF